MNSPIDAVYALVRDTDPDVLDADDLDRFTSKVAELKAWCDARQVPADHRPRSSGELIDDLESVSPS